jgi:hypothetical protein
MLVVLRELYQYLVFEKKIDVNTFLLYIILSGRVTISPGGVTILTGEVTMSAGGNTGTQKLI